MYHVALYVCANQIPGLQGMYPALVMILVQHQRSSQTLVSTAQLDNKLNVNFTSSKTAPLGSLRFSDGPAAQSRTGNVTSTVHTDHSTVHVTMDTRGRSDSLGTISEDDWLEEGHADGLGRREDDWRRVKLDLA